MRRCVQRHETSLTCIGCTALCLRAAAKADSAITGVVALGIGRNSSPDARLEGSDQSVTPVTICGWLRRRVILVNRLKAAMRRSWQRLVEATSSRSDRRASSHGPHHCRKYDTTGPRAESPPMLHSSLSTHYPLYKATSVYVDQVVVSQLDACWAPSESSTLPQHVRTTDHGFTLR